MDIIKTASAVNERGRCMADRNHLVFVFVHGLSGWGSYDRAYKRMPYWGMRNGDLMEQLRQAGYDCVCASVAPSGSAYDRACELYAQLSGSRTDYGEVHSRAYGHSRYGRDFTGIPLIPVFDENTRLVLIGHSFGGASIRMFAHILEHGVPEEQGEDCSPFFLGRRGRNLAVLAAIAAPHNGTTAYDMYDDPSFDPSSVKSTWLDDRAAALMSRSTEKNVPQNPEDSAAYDMHIDHALAMNRKMTLSAHVYYFSQPCEITVKNPDGTYSPASRQTEPMFRRTAKRMGAYSGRTAGGFVIDESWRPSDGLVNTVSAAYPIGNPHTAFDPEHIEPGIWNVFETYHGDHMALQGGMMLKHKVLPYYTQLLEMISSLPVK